MYNEYRRKSQSDRGVLMQINTDRETHIVSKASRVLTQMECPYSLAE